MHWPYYIIIVVKQIHSSESTLTPYSSIFWMPRVTSDKRATWTINETILTATALSIVKVNWACSSTKCSITEGNCTCWHKCYFTMKFNIRKFGKITISDLDWNNLVVDTPQQHHCFPKSCHTQYPTNCSHRFQVCLHLQCFLLPVVAGQLCKELSAGEASNCMHYLWG